MIKKCGWKIAAVLAGWVVASAAHAGAAGTFGTVFNPTTVPINGTSTLTYTLTAYDNFRNLGFTTTLPAGLVVATPNGAATDCGPVPGPLLPTITAVPGSTTVQLANANTTTVYDGPFMGPRSFGCVVSVRIQGAVLGSHALPPVTLLDSGFPTLLTASAVLNVLGAPVAAASIPTLSEWGLILLVLAMAASALNGMRRKRG
ncbi:IPTL-CTERM sorting domain-containing protein [Acidovorax sp. LjRoot194]|uniref:IPTL-CTERM sorting domain-containing protein n=1 Tax=Acidovorax sp. LjRoot194 TaxID=3342280 RepID=UPI003ED01ECA